MPCALGPKPMRRPLALHRPHRDLVSRHGSESTRPRRLHEQRVSPRWVFGGVGRGDGNKSWNHGFVGTRGSRRYCCDAVDLARQPQARCAALVNSNCRLFWRDDDAFGARSSPATSKRETPWLTARNPVISVPSNPNAVSENTVAFLFDSITGYSVFGLLHCT